MESLLRAMLRWPLVWRLACVIIRKRYEHVDSADCILCVALARPTKFNHSFMMGQRREGFCGKCGLPLSAWLRKRKCPGKRPPAKPEAPPTFFMWLDEKL